MFNALYSLKPYAHWLLRIALASLFLYHWFGKVMNLGGFVELTGLPMPVAALVTFAEVAGGAGIIVGSATYIAHREIQRRGQADPKPGPH